MYPKEYFNKNNIIESCIIEVTNQCNCACIHCDFPKLKNGDFVSLNMIDKIIHDLNEIGTIRVTLSGGEPFEHKEIIKIIKKFISAGFLVQVLTNGINITQEQIEELKNLNKLSIVFSVHGVSSIHDEITNVKGAFEKIIDNIKMLSNSKCKVSVQTSVIKNNYNYLCELVSYFDKLNVSYKIDPNITNTLNNPKIDKIRLSNNELIDFYKNYTSLPEITQKVLNQNLEVRIGLCDCGVAKNTIAIDCYGNMMPCGNYRVKLGNVKDSNIISIWKNNELLIELRNRNEKDRKKCMNCKMKTLCNRCIAMSIQENNNWHIPSIESCRQMKCLKEAVNYDY